MVKIVYTFVPGFIIKHFYRESKTYLQKSQKHNLRGCASERKGMWAFWDYFTKMRMPLTMYTPLGMWRRLLRLPFWVTRRPSSV